ncbi:MAG: hypothetical protein HYY28_02455 [Betaproteobacteria bacterium]|nr:hypothetical protein [Betaproteobacteria bacterium]
MDNLLRIGKLKPHAADKADGVAQECVADAAAVLAEVRAWIAAFVPISHDRVIT